MARISSAMACAEVNKLRTDKMITEKNICIKEIEIILNIEAKF
jgi:hypothetical protein